MAVEDKINGEQFSITLCGQEIPIQRRMLPQADLRFYAMNPRVYSLVRSDSGEPDQEELESTLVKMDHVKKLIQAIRANGGLTDPLLVRGSDNVVLEGNSRLAAYRVLARSDALRWGRVKCDVVPADISEDHVFALLVQYHVVGRKDWDPFEQAGLFWRRYNDGVQANQIAKEMEDIGFSARRVQQMIDVYSLMVKHNDMQPSRWSYYEEFLKSRALKRASEEHPELTKIFVHKIKTGEIARAIDVRDKVDRIARAGGKPLVDFIQRKATLDTCFAEAEAGGVNNMLYNKLRKFREVVADPGVKKGLQDMPENQVARCLFELKKIKNAVERLVEQLER